MVAGIIVFLDLRHPSTNHLDMIRTQANRLHAYIAHNHKATAQRKRIGGEVGGTTIRCREPKLA